jgi:hypothetical protein
MDYISASLLLESRAIREALFDLKNKEINMGFITEITNDSVNFWRL